MRWPRPCRAATSRSSSSGANCRAKRPLVIAENPTWGVDIGAIELIHAELMRMRDTGHAVLLVSTELDEILRLSDRILVMYSGSLSEPDPGGGSRPQPDRRADDVARRQGAGRRVSARTRDWLSGDLLPWIITLAWILAILFALMLLVERALRRALIQGFFDGAFGGRRFAYLMATLSRATLIVGMALSVMLSLPRRPVQHRRRRPARRRRPGLGAGRASCCRARRSLVLVVAILAGMAAGALWALLAGALYLYVGVPLLVGSLLLNFPIRYLASYLVAHPFRDVPSGMVQSHLVPDADLAALLSRRSARHRHPVHRRGQHPGHRLQPQNRARLPGATEWPGAGFRPRGRPAGVSGSPCRRLAMSGAIAGLVGAIAVFGIHHRYIDGMLVQPLYAWTGIIAVLLVGMIPWLVPFSGFFFAAIQTGAAGMERAARRAQGDRPGHAGRDHPVRRQPRLGAL